ncbi:MAG: DNA topoisomerase (ATP-hydrolyzing) subunit B [Saprospiraceae bacterium]|nr:DNA topoisomerase (ATP-hydrolyzing) subunit B [Saprospiraceae bacterium]
MEITNKIDNLEPQASTPVDTTSELENKGDYDASNIQALEGLEAVRKRPGMYIGSTDTKGLHHLVYEVIDNSIDEHLAGFCKNIDVIIHKDNSVTVRDDGRGIPTGIQKKLNKSALEVVMTVLHAGGKFDKNTYKVSGGLHGVGVSCVNALSIYLRAEVRRDGKIFIQEYKQGKPQNEVHIIGETSETGTTVTFKPDAEIFEVLEYKFDTLANRMRELAFLNKGLHLTLIDERDIEDDGSFKKTSFFSEGGIKEFVLYLDETKTKLIEEPIYVFGVKDNIEIEVAIIYNTSYVENIMSFVNNINTRDGGTHVGGFRRALTREFKNYGDENSFFKKLDKITISGEDFREGLTAIVSVKVPEPQFKGQTKGELGNSEVTGIVSQFVGEALKHFLEENPNKAKRIIEKVILAATARHAAQKAREMVQRKNILTGGGLPGKLADCSSKSPHECEIFLVEGDSAGGTAKQGRDRNTQAILPLRGKILNVEKAMEHRIYESEEIKNIFTALGVSIEERDGERILNIEKLRYYKIVIMCDADIDGSHIVTLILTFFFRYMKPLIERGHVYIASPPLYMVKKGKQFRYCWTEEERREAVATYSKGEVDDSVKTQRYKGLGEMNAEQLWETTMDPTTRIIKKVTIEDAAECDRIFSMLMGDDVPPRRAFIEANARYAKVDI